MAHHISGRVHWDTTRAATPGWLLFLDGLPGEAPRMLPAFETRLPREASQAEVARLIEAMLCRETGHRPQEVQVTPIRPDGSVDWEEAYEAVSHDLSEGGIALLQE